jgi:hypothetical protein
VQGRGSQEGSKRDVGLFLQEEEHDVGVAVAAGDVEGVGELLPRGRWRTRQPRAIGCKAAAAGARCAGDELAGVIEVGLDFFQRTDSRRAEEAISPTTAGEGGVGRSFRAIQYGATVNPIAVGQANGFLETFADPFRKF